MPLSNKYNIFRNAYNQVNKFYIYNLLGALVERDFSRVPCNGRNILDPQVMKPG